MGVEAPPGLLAIEDAKPDEQIRKALSDLQKQLRQNAESQPAEWVHSTEAASMHRRHVRGQEAGSTWILKTSGTGQVTGKLSIVW